MNSIIFEYLMSYGIDPAYIMIGLLVVMLILIAAYIRCAIRMKKLYKAYDSFMKGKNMESLEDTLHDQFDRIQILEQADRGKREELDTLKEMMQHAIQKTGLVKYDAFREMSGDLSYALVLLDQEDNGMVVTSMYSREGCFSYAKEIEHGKSSINLSEEEQEALKKAISGYKITE